MGKISDRTGNADMAKNAMLSVAHSYEKRKEYNEAYLKWSEISMRWPTGEMAKDALLAMARNKYAAYRGAAYDGSSLIAQKPIMRISGCATPKRRRSCMWMIFCCGLASSWPRKTCL